MSAVLEHGHHAEAEQIDLDDAQIGAIVLVPLDDDAARHGGGFQRHDASSGPGRSTMPPECWPRWRGRSCSATTSVEKFADARIVEIEAGFAELLLGCVCRDRCQPHMGASARDACPAW